MAAPTAASPGAKSADRPIRRPGRKAPFPLNLYQTFVGKKWVMAVTGLMLIGFVLSHLFGNIKLYIGVVQEGDEFVYDADLYGEFLRELLVPLFPHGWLLWILRFGLIGAFGLHIHSAYSLKRVSQAANQSYASKRDWLAANFASRSMRWTGPIVMIYLIFHLADLTWGWIPNTDWEKGAIQANVVNSFSNPGIALIYIVANVALSIHLYHGMYSLFQSLGINNPRYNQLRRSLATVVAGVILVGNVSFPIAVQTGIIEFDPSLIGPVG